MNFVAITSETYSELFERRLNRIFVLGVKPGLMDGQVDAFIRLLSGTSLAS